MICHSDGDDGAGEAEAAFHGGTGETSRAAREETPGTREQEEQEERGTKVNQLQDILVHCVKVLALFLPAVEFLTQSSGFRIDFALTMVLIVCVRLICYHSRQVLLYMELCSNCTVSRCVEMTGKWS